VKTIDQSNIEKITTDLGLVYKQSQQLEIENKLLREQIEFLS